MKKQVGNAVRTKCQIRGSKSKGSSFEYDVLHNLKKTFPDLYLTSKQGFQQQIDLLDDVAKVAVECKRVRSVSWNQAKKWFDKLISVAPKDYFCVLVFKSNQQPVLIMTQSSINHVVVIEFEQGVGVFEKHPSTRVKKEVFSNE